MSTHQLQLVSDACGETFHELCGVGQQIPGLEDLMAANGVLKVDAPAVDEDFDVAEASPAELLSQPKPSRSTGYKI